eukprot:1983710-Prymnesium_polylepis.1
MLLWGPLHALLRLPHPKFRLMSPGPTKVACYYELRFSIFVDTHSYITVTHPNPSARDRPLTSPRDRIRASTGET